VAAEIRGALGIESRLERGDHGEFTVWVDGEKVAQKGLVSFPRPEHVVDLIRKKRALATDAEAEPEPTRRA